MSPLKIKRPDYNGDSVVSFDEAHAYTLLTSDTIDIPATTSGEFLGVYSRFGDDEADLLSDHEPYGRVLKLASPSQKAILDGLSEQLGLTGSDRIAVAEREAEGRRGRGRRGRRGGREVERLKRRIASEVKERWPELSNVLNPIAIALLTDRSEEFIRSIEQHPDYSRYRELTAAQARTSSDEKRRPKYHRFLRTADNVVYAENLKRIDDRRYRQYLSIVAGESQSLKNHHQPSQVK